MFSYQFDHLREMSFYFINSVADQHLVNNALDCLHHGSKYVN